MIVRKTLHQICEEMLEIRKMRECYGILVARALLEGGDGKAFLDEYKHYDELLNYRSQVFVEYEDKYESEEEDE